MSFPILDVGFLDGVHGYIPTWTVCVPPSDVKRFPGRFVVLDRLMSLVFETISSSWLTGANRNDAREQVEQIMSQP